MSFFLFFLFNFHAAHSEPPTNGGRIVPAVNNDSSSAAPASEHKREMSSCMLSEAELKIWLSSPETLIVDLRVEVSDESERIPEALVIPAHSLKSKTYLQTKSILLLAQPYAAREPQDLCSTLRISGFKNVGMVPYGLWGLRTAGAQLNQNLSTRPNYLVPVSAGALVKELFYRPWLVVIVSKENYELPLPGGTMLTFISANENTFNKEIALLINSQELTGNDIPVALLFDNKVEGERLQRTLGMFETQNGHPVFVVEGGRSVIEQYLQQQKQLMSQKAERNKIKECQ